MKKPVFYGMLSAILFSSCDFVNKSSGIVLDKETKKPISNAYISRCSQIDTTSKGLHTFGLYTDSLGYYGYHGGAEGTPDFDLFFDAKGYKKVQRGFHSVSINDTILLEKK